MQQLEHLLTNKIAQLQKFKNQQNQQNAQKLDKQIPLINRKLTQNRNLSKQNRHNLVTKSKNLSYPILAQTRSRGSIRDDQDIGAPLTQNVQIAATQTDDQEALMTTINEAMAQGTDINQIVEMLQQNSADPSVAALLQSLTGATATTPEPEPAATAPVIPIAPNKKLVALKAVKPAIQAVTDVDTATKASLAEIAAASTGATTSPQADLPAAEPIVEAAAVPATDDKVKDLFGGAGDDDNLQNASKEQKQKHFEKVRNEGLTVPKNSKLDDKQEIVLELEEPSSANEVAEKGAKTIQNDDEFLKLVQQLEDARKKQENQIGQGGFQIDLKDPKEFANHMNIVLLDDIQNMSSVQVNKYDTTDQAQSVQASQIMAQALQGDSGATIVDDGQQGRENVIQNLNSDVGKLASQISGGYSIRNSLIQKMAPGDKQFHMISWDMDKARNDFKTIQKRSEADEYFSNLGQRPKILISGETGDVLLADGEQNMINQCVGYFYTQRYQGKYFGQP